MKWTMFKDKPEETKTNPVKVVEPEKKHQSAEEMAQEAKNKAEANKRIQEIQGSRNGVEVCKKTLAFLEVCQVQGNKALDMVNSIGWLQGIQKTLEDDLKRLEIAPKLILPK